MSELKLPAAEVRKGDWLFVETVPYARPTALTVGWHKVLEAKRTNVSDVVSLQVLEDRMDERNHELFFNQAAAVTIRRAPATQVSR